MPLRFGLLNLTRRRLDRQSCRTTSGTLQKAATAKRILLGFRHFTSLPLGVQLTRKLVSLRLLVLGRLQRRERLPGCLRSGLKSERGLQLRSRVFRPAEPGQGDAEIGPQTWVGRAE